MAKFVDKSQLNLDRTTNAIALCLCLCLLAGGLGLASGVISKAELLMAWETIFGLSVTVMAWLMGSPSPETKKLLKKMGLNDQNADDFLRLGIDDRLRNHLGIPDPLDYPRPKPGLDDRLFVNPEYAPNPTAAAWEAAHKARRQTGQPQLPKNEMATWQIFNDRRLEADDDDDVIPTEGW